MKIVLDDLQNMQYLKNFPESELNIISGRETGLIAERIIGNVNTEKEKIKEFSIINFHSAVKSRFYQGKKESDPEIHEVEPSGNRIKSEVDCLRSAIDVNRARSGEQYVTLAMTNDEFYVDFGGGVALENEQYLGG